MKLELKHIAPYLPYGLIVKHNDEDTLLTDLHVSGIINPVKYEAGITSVIDVDEVKPILRPIRSITEDEAFEFLKRVMPESKRDLEKGSYTFKNDEGIMCFNNKDYRLCDYSLIVDNDSMGVECEYKTGGYSCYYPNISGYEWLFKHHFDVFGLIKKGLAVDKTKLK